MSKPPPLQTRLICRISAQLGEVQDIGQVPGGRRRVVPIAGGRVEGPRLQGEIVPGGADWQVIAADGTVSVEARYTLRADDGGLILVHSRGVRNGEPAVMARLLAGEDVDSSEYYFRTLVTLESSAPAHAWVNGRLFIAAAAREPAAVLIDLYEIL
ncbi:MAG TPA: DUF3237 domain-containing protein [Solirubrobacteraceae bacterium]|nr:DUF3237 domain-containing protein [Solirubrobacteraceae bacterium]